MGRKTGTKLLICILFLHLILGIPDLLLHTSVTHAGSAEVFHDTFEDAAGNNGLAYRDHVGVVPSVYGDPMDDNGHVIRMNIDSGTVWNELKRYMPSSLSGDVLLQYRVWLKSTTNGPVPRIYDATTPIGQILFNGGNLVLQTDGALPVLPNGENVQLNQWVDVSLELNTSSHEYTAWVGTKPDNVTYYPMLSHGDTVNTISFIEEGTDAGLYLDNVTAAIITETLPTPTPTPTPFVFHDTFEDAAGNNGLAYWDHVGVVPSVYGDPTDANGHVIRMNIDSGTAWNELKRFMPSSLVEMCCCNTVFGSKAQRMGQYREFTMRQRQSVKFCLMAATWCCRQMGHCPYCPMGRTFN